MQKNKGMITVEDIKIPSQKLVYTLNIPNASVEDTGNYECAAQHVINDVTKTQKIVITVYGTICFLFPYDSQFTKTMARY